MRRKHPILPPTQLTHLAEDLERYQKVLHYWTPDRPKSYYQQGRELLAWLRESPAVLAVLVMGALLLIAALNPMWSFIVEAVGILFILLTVRNQRPSIWW